MPASAGLDLVEVSPTAVPPVCRIQDYGRFLYEKEKSERAARKKQKVITIKEVKFSVTVDEHDYQTKKNQAVRFLTEGDKVKASLRFRGRQMAHRELGYAIINRLIQDIGDAGTVEFMPRMEGTILHAILAPSKKQEQPKPKPAAPAQPQAAPVGALVLPFALRLKGRLRAAFSFVSSPHVPDFSAVRPANALQILKDGRYALSMRLSRKLGAYMLAFVLTTASSMLCAAEEPHFPTTDDLRHLKSIGGPQLSPDGKLVLVTITDATADGGKSHLWLVSTAAGEKPRQITFSPPSEKRGERNPQWAPDGSAIYFLAKSGEQTQLFRLDLRGGEAAPYELKVVPVVDQSKDKNAIPPPGVEKKEDDKTRDGGERGRQDGEAGRSGDCFPSMLPVMLRPRTANGWRCGPRIPKLRARKSRRTPRPMPSGSTTEFTRRACIWQRSRRTGPWTAC